MAGHHIGPYSRPGPLVALDLRTREARLLKRVRKDLLAHVGGSPSATERALIDRAAWLSLRVAQLDRKIAEGGGDFTLHDSRTYLAWSNSLTRALSQLGLKPAATAPSLAELLTATERKRGAAA